MAQDEDLKKAEDEDLTKIDPAFIKMGEALEIEIDCVKKTAIENSIEITNGNLQDHVANEYIYSFKLDDSLLLNEETPIEFIVGENTYTGSIVSIIGRDIRISINENLGKEIAHASIKTNNSFLLERLKDRLENVSKIDDVSVFNTDLALKTLGLKKSKIKINSSLKEKPESLNDNQFNALKVISGSELLYLWGPPGTGKTFTLAEVIYYFYKNNKKILLVSNTNMAVDILLKSLCDQLTKIKDKDFKEASVLRFGKIINEEVSRKYKEYIDLDEVVKRLTTPLQMKITELTKKLDKLYEKIKPIDDDINNYYKYQKMKKENIDREAEIEDFKLFINESGPEITTKERSINDLKKELGTARSSTVIGTVANWFAGKRSKEDIERHISELKMELNELKVKLKNAPEKLKELSGNLKRLKKSESELEKKVKNLSIEPVESKRDIMQKDISDITSEITKVQNEIDKKKTELLDKCRVTAATATQTYLKWKIFKTYDLVVIDESSMLHLPLVFYVSGLASQKVTVTGDFKQLPPIVQSLNKSYIDEDKQEVVKRWMAIDVFQKSGVADSVETNTLPDNLVQLKVQYRMEKVICDLINNRFYYGSLITDKKAGKLRDSYPNFFSSSLILIDTQEYQPFCNVKPRSNSKYNLLHAIAIRNLVRSLVKSNFIKSPKDLGIITPYNTQAKIIRKILDDEELKNIECGTVHRFQGNEKDIIIFDTVETYGLPWIGGMFNDFKVMNVALSRAKGFLITFANIKYMEERLKQTALMKDILIDIQEKGVEKKLSEVVELSPKTLSKDVADYKPVSTTKYKDREVTTCDEKTFYETLKPDLHKAKKWIIIYSPFCTEKRVAWWADIIRKKTEEGVIIKCVIRPPDMRNPSQSYKAYQLLIDLGAIIDLRYEMHQKYIWIDNDIFWVGSLNALSHNNSEETMLRTINNKIGLQSAQLEIYRKGKRSGSSIEALAGKENPPCPECGSPDVVFHSRSVRRPGKKFYGFGGYFKCHVTKCNWIKNYDQYFIDQYLKANDNSDKTSGKTKMTKSISESDVKSLLQEIEDCRKKDIMSNKERDFTKPGGNVMKRLEKGESLSPKQQKWLDDILSRCR
ncbi:MAG: AAA domain-containing protein [Pseudomonadota bacterium]|nr:AAA domain-containing protein [Pseudomonadota bacterium]